MLHQYVFTYTRIDTSFPWQVQQNYLTSSSRIVSVASKSSLYEAYTKHIQSSQYILCMLFYDIAISKTIRGVVSEKRIQPVQQPYQLVHIAYHTRKGLWRLEQGVSVVPAWVSLASLAHLALSAQYNDNNIKNIMYCLKMNNYVTNV